ncbi:hypothetical protein LCGC14_1188000 [marine sediment metagenome]|uniref:FCP1 homology domain-containing protein n=1 Tax=marine sediment metagenome TaxID=412755 RepID=A0A0F9P307_9ZZZZ
MIEIAYLDMDGVIVDFLGGLHRALGVPYDIDCYPYEKGKWNMLLDIKPPGIDGVPITFEQCNALCTVNFWANLEWTSEGTTIFEMVCEKFGSENVYLLTTCMPNPGTTPGKMRWLERYLPGPLGRAIIVGPGVSKGLLAKPNAVLIDDRDKNIAEFTAAGGYGILVNRPWNAGHERADHTVSDLELDLLDLPGGSL